ncbi:protein DMP3-like [Oryza glaberrima]|uniref:DUF679 domain-containing protein n=2 Tax=Oryza TaxID=4527 RepID=A0A0D3ENT7_9ORYZ|nr:protein DMP3-like [Oryza glaberrima]
MGTNGAQGSKGASSTTTNPTNDDKKKKPAQAPGADADADADGGGKKNNSDYVDKTLSTTANLVKLLPTGTTLAFQALSPSFTNHGRCLAINRYISGGLIAFCCAICALLSFTDSIIDRKGRPYYGLAFPADEDTGKGGFVPFNYEKPRRPSNGASAAADDDDDSWEVYFVDFDPEELYKRRLRPLDFLHATLRVFVFLALAFSDAGIQTCLFPQESATWREALVNMPLGVGFVASFVFMIFPSTRKGVGYPREAQTGTEGGADADKDGKAEPPKTTTNGGSGGVDAERSKQKNNDDCPKTTTTNDGSGGGDGAGSSVQKNSANQVVPIQPSTKEISNRADEKIANIV